MEISQFFARVKFLVDKSEIDKINKLFANTEKKLNSVGKATEKVNKEQKESTKQTKAQAVAKEQEAKSVNKLAQATTRLSAAVAKLPKGELQKRLSYIPDTKDVPKTVASMKKLQKSYEDLWGAALGVKATGANRGAWNQNFKNKIGGMVVGSQSAKSLKEQQKMYENLFGAKPQARVFTQAQVNAAQKNYSKMINERLGFMGGEQSTLSREMSAFYRAQEREAEKSAKKIADNKIKENKRVNDAIEKGIRDLEKAESVKAINRRTNRRAFFDSQETPRAQRSNASINRANYLHAGGAAGAFARYGAASLPAVGGVYGLASLNTANQELMSQTIAAESVLGSRSGELMNWFKQQADYMGVSYMQNLPQFTKFMASASPLMGADVSKDVFRSFLQFGRTRGATSVSMNRALNAVSQMSA